jgi:hypothetical protein
MFHYLKAHGIRFLSGMTSLHSENNDME